MSALERAGVAPPLVVDTAAVVGEMVSNAARHARTDFTVSVSLERGMVRLEVFDRDTRPPSLLGLDFDSTSGRGLHIVAALASDWGWQTAEDEGVAGKLVWAELAIDRGTTPTGSDLRWRSDSRACPDGSRHVAWRRRRNTEPLAHFRLPQPLRALPGSARVAKPVPVPGGIGLVWVDMRLALGSER